MVIIAIVAEDFSVQTIQDVMISLGILIVVMILTIIVYRLVRARPELFKRSSQKKRFRTPYASVESDSYQYTPNKSSGKKPYTDFCLKKNQPILFVN